MERSRVAEARQPLRRNPRVLAAAAAAAISGALLVYETLVLLQSGESLLSAGALWFVLVCWFTLALVASLVWSRPANHPQT